MSGLGVRLPWPAGQNRMSKWGPTSAAMSKMSAATSSSRPRCPNIKWCSYKAAISINIFATVPASRQARSGR